MLTSAVSQTSPNPLTYTNVDQDNIVADLVNRAINMASPFNFTSYLPINLSYYNPTGGPRTGGSGQVRTRTYQGGQSIGTAIDDMSKVINGFDYNILTDYQSGLDYLTIWYPYQGPDADQPPSSCTARTSLP